MYTKFIKYLRYSLPFILLGIMIAGIIFTSCKDKEGNGIGGTTVLYSYGPMPIARGAELRFIGVNLDKVTSIVLPGGIEIQAASFVTKTSSLVTITVPQNAIPGLVVVKAPEGDITTKTPIGFSEPISITSFSPALIKAGQELTITGDYLNLVKAVIFTDRISVDSATFISKSRSQIKVIVPAAAQTGKIAVSNGKEDPIIVYSTTLLSVKLPVITTFLPNPVKAGTNLTITGTDLDLVKTVALGGSQNVTSFVSQTATQLILKIPDITQDDTLRLLPASGVKVKSSAKLVLVVPFVNVTPTTIKNGDDITVTGTDLDLINTVVFGGDKNGIIKVGGTTTQIVVAVPNDARTGIVKFTTKASKEVAGPSITIVDPVLTLFAPAAANAKTDIIITGLNLDLVVDVAFVGGMKGTIGTRTATQLVVTVPVGAKTGKITLIPKNGVQVQSATELVVLANLPVITSISEAKGIPGKKLTINGTKMDLIKTIIFPGNIAATEYGMKTATMVEVYVPLTVLTGRAQAKMITYEGEEGFLPELFYGSTDPIVDPALVLSNVSDGRAGTWDGSYAEIGENAAIALDGKYIHCIPSAASGWHWVWGNNWFAFPAVTKADYYFKIDVMLTKPFGALPAFQMEFGGTRVDIGSLKFSASETTEGWITVTYDLSTFSSLPATINSGGEWGINTNISGTADISGLYMDNFRFQHK